jgi:acetolactate synthase-1/2/3 large subunit
MEAFMKNTAGRFLYETLKAYGVTHLFGMDEPVHLYDALDRRIIKPITIRDEKHGVIMAHGYAKATHKPGVCTSIRGAGTTNLISGLAEAFKSSTPIIAIISEVSPRYRGKNASQEIDQASLLKSVVKSVEVLDDPNRVCEMTRKVFRIATSGRPGPAALLCPQDVLSTLIDIDVYSDPGYEKYPSNRTCADRRSIEAAADLLLQAKRPLIIGGGGCLISQASAEVIELAEMLHLPVATTIMGKGLIPDSHPLSIGVMGSYTGGKYGRGAIANRLVSMADLAFIMGSRTDQIPYSDWSLPKKGTEIIHLDIDPEEIGRNFRTRLAMVGDVKETLRELLAHCAQSNVKPDNEWQVKEIDVQKKTWRSLNEPLFNSVDVPIRPERVLKEISSHLDEKSIIVTDASYVSSWAASHIDNLIAGGNFIFPRAMAGIGWGLPAAMGVSLGQPGKTVFCLTGDGAFGYVMNELETAARYNIKVITLVFNNGSFGFQKHYEESIFGKSVECELLDINYAQVAVALGCKGERVIKPEEINNALSRALVAETPYVLDIVIDPNAIAPLTMFDNFGVKKISKNLTGFH